MHIFHIRGQQERGSGWLHHYWGHLDSKASRQYYSIIHPFFLDIGWMPAAFRDRIQFHMVSYCSAIKVYFNIRLHDLNPEFEL